jgi:FkbM family methyltransferase
MDTKQVLKRILPPVLTDVIRHLRRTDGKVRQGRLQPDLRYSLHRYETRHGVYYLPDIETDAVVNAMRSGEIFEEEIVETARQYIRKGSCVVDLGANFGQMTLLFSQLVGDTGHVYAVEADDFVFNVLQQNITANGRSNVTALLGAVHEQDDLTLFYPTPDFKRFGAFGSYGIDPTATTGRTVHTFTIDSLNIERDISFMKVDLQGCDLFAMRGARKTIKRCRMPIVFEYEAQLQKEFATSFEDYSRFVESIDYRIKDVIYAINYLIVPK